MAHQSTNWQDISSLATLLRDSGDRVLSGNSKLRLTPALLSKLNSAFSSISLLDSNGEFQVTSAHASQPPTTAQLHFLHDFVQKTVGLTIAGNGKKKGDIYKAQSVDLSRFRSLRHLELRSCTLSDGGSHSRGCLEGLSLLRLQLEALVLIQVFHSEDLLWEVLANGAVSIGPGVIWTKLSQLVVSYCGLRTFGRGLSLACYLQWLDISHNLISDADALSSSLTALPKLCYLNLSYNRLTRIPVPQHDSAYPVPTKIQILLLSHNYIENLDGLQHLTSLRELNIEVNQLQHHSSLLPVRSLYQLQNIKLKGNPISYHKRHRILTSCYLPPRAVFQKHRYRRGAEKLIPFMFDGHKLSEQEMQAVRDGPLTPISNSTGHVSDDAPIESRKLPECSASSGSEMERSTRKSRKVREVIIEDFDTLEELTDRSFGTNQMIGSIESSGEHLQTKRQLETVKAHFKEDWLRAHAGSTVQELLGLQPSTSPGLAMSSRPLSSSTPLNSPSLMSSGMPVPYPGHLDEQQVLESIILRRSPDPAESTQSTQYHTANDSDTVLHISTENDKTISNENGQPHRSVMGYDADEEEEEDQGEQDSLTDPKDRECEDLGSGDHSTYLVTKVTQGQKSPRDLFLVTTSRFLKEVDPNSGAVVQHWRIKSLESCVLLSASPCQVQLTFKTVVPNKKKRTYEMDADEAQKQLLPSLKAVLEARSLSALNVAAFTCMKCSGEFSMELNSRKASKKCPNCGSTLVFEQDEAPLPTLAQSSSQQQPAIPEAEPSSEPALLHSPSDSSIGSAVSLESPCNVAQPSSGFSSTINPSLRRCESDIDIISNPSQSSIEILEDTNRSNGTPGRKRSSEERQVVAIPSLVTVPEVTNPLPSLPAGLTESSSSGSITDSVCTAYENNTGTGGTGLRRGLGLAKSTLLEESSRENSPHYQEESENIESSPQPTSMSNVLDNLLQSMSSKISAMETVENRLAKKNAALDSAIKYNYVDFSAVDHRLKLHLHLAILDADEREVIQLLLRGEVITAAPENRYPGILLISSEKVYIMKITGPEEGDAVDRWISRVIAIPREKLQSITALPWGMGISLSLQSSSLNNLMIIVRDPQYTKNLFAFLSELPQEPSWKIEELPSEKYTLAVTEALQNIVRGAFPDSDSSIKLAVFLCSSIVSKDDDEQIYSGGSLLVTQSSLLLNSDDCSWLMAPESTSSFSSSAKCIAKQTISNLIQVESDGAQLWLQFLDETAGEDETWKLNLQSTEVLEEIVAVIRTPWEELFSVPLHVFHISPALKI